MFKIPLNGIDIPTTSLSCAEVVAAGKSGFPELPSVSAMLDDSTHTLSGISQQAQKLQQQMLEVQQEKWSMFFMIFLQISNRSFSKKKGTFELMMIFLFPRWGCLFSSLADIPPLFFRGGGGGWRVLCFVCSEELLNHKNSRNWKLKTWHLENLAGECCSHEEAEGSLWSQVAGTGREKPHRGEGEC